MPSAQLAEPRGKWVFVQRLDEGVGGGRRIAGRKRLFLVMDDEEGRNHKADDDDSGEDDDEEKVRAFGVFAVIGGGIFSAHGYFDAELALRVIGGGDYSSRPGRAMRSRMASRGALSWCRMRSICSAMGISTA